MYERDANGTSVDRSTGQRYSKRTDRVTVEASLEKGMKHGQQLKFEGKGNVIPGMLPGDVVLVLQEIKHSVFERRGADLIMKKEISLYEALTGACVLSVGDGGRVCGKRLPARASRA